MEPVLQAPHARVTEPSRARRVIDMRNCDDDAEKIGVIVAKRKASKHARHRVLGTVVGWPAGHRPGKRMRELLSLPVCRRELQRLAEQAVPSWATAVPLFRIVHVLVSGSMGAYPRRPDRWTRHDRGLPDWEIEDYYTRFILRCIKVISYEPHYRELASWVHEANDDEKIYIFFHVAMLFQYEIKFDKWRKLSWYRKLALSVFCKKRKKLYH